jgi:hypothetical protein
MKGAIIKMHYFLGGDFMTDNTRSLQLAKPRLISAGNVFLRVVTGLLLVFLGLFFICAVHEWAGHIFADALVFAKHGTTIRVIDMRVFWLNVTMLDGRWSLQLVKWASFFPPAGVSSVIPNDMNFSLTDYEIGISNLSGCIATALISLITLVVLNLRKKFQIFPWFAMITVVWVVLFDELIYTFVSPTPEPLVSGVQMGADPILIKVIVIGLVLLQAMLSVRFFIRYKCIRSAALNA